jgi:hypothetical protein
MYDTVATKNFRNHLTFKGGHKSVSEQTVALKELWLCSGRGVGSTLLAETIVGNCNDRNAVCLYWRILRDKKGLVAACHTFLFIDISIETYIV